MVEPENHFTVFIRLPFNRGDFIDPPPVAWSAAKERELWDIISRSSKGNEIDWKKLSEDFQVTQPFLLQQAAWLYERQLSQVRAQMRRMGGRQSASASPVPASTTGSVVTAQTTKRASISSRAPSRLSTQTVNTANVTESTTPITPVRSRTALPFRSGSGATSSHLRGVPTSRPLSRKSSRDNESISRTHSRRGSVQHQLTRSPIDLEPPEQSSSEEEPAASKTTHRRPNSASLQRRPPSLRKSQHTRQSSITHQQVDEETEEEDSPAFLPPVNLPEKSQEPISTRPDPSATIIGDYHQTPQSTRPVLTRNVTSERIRPSAQSPPSNSKPAPATTTTAPPSTRPLSNPQSTLASSTSSLSSSNNTSSALRPQQTQQPRVSQTQQTSAPTPHRPSPSVLPNPLSPRQQAALATAAGLSPRRRSTNTPHSHSHSHTGPGSESSPSMGSSFSDLDDASVTQSALEEALMSNMGSTTTTSTAIGSAPMTTATGAMGAAVGNALGSRVSGISQALRSRYFDARSGEGQR